jgi:CBS domain-containing protein
MNPMDKPKLASDIMVTDLVTFTPNSDVFDAVKMLLKRQITGGPVIDACRNYLGVFSEKRCLNVLTRVVRLGIECNGAAPRVPTAKDFMATQLVTLSPESDVVQAIGYLLKHHISGAPVIDPEGNFLGVFSEKSSMSVLVQAAYEQLPSTKVGAYMNTDFDRTITEDVSVQECAERFLSTPFRRLPVLREGKLVGQVSRRDVIRSQYELTLGLSDRHILVLDTTEHVTRGESPGVATTEAEVSTVVRDVLDTDARTITEDDDLLSIAQIYLQTPYRRLPVLRDELLVGQISRRDVLSATHDLMKIVEPKKKNPLLYLSALVDRTESPIS